MITVWGRRNSLNVQKVLWALGELDLPFERHNVGGSFGGNDTADFKALNPNGLVPVIRDGDIVMFESNAIVRYLGARYGHNGLKPKDAAGLAASEQWMDWTQLTLGPPAMALFMQRVRTAPEKQNPAAIENAIGQLKKVMPVVDQALAASPYLGGDELTFGDIPLGCLSVAAQRLRLAAAGASQSTALVRAPAGSRGLSEVGDDPGRAIAGRVARQREGAGLGKPCAQLSGKVLDELPGDAAGSAAARRRPFDGARIQRLARNVQLEVPRIGIDHREIVVLGAVMEAEPEAKAVRK